MGRRDRDDALIEALLRPECYPHAVEEPIRRVETHVSWVLLTGPYAYKIKKPLKLSFLDYSDPAARRTFCEQELRLNRRYAPDLYLDVVGIARRRGAVEIGVGLEDADEFAVRMRQFDRSQELDVLLRSGAVEPEELTALGEFVGGFHAGAGHAPPSSDYGRPGRVHGITLDNFSHLADMQQRSVSRQHVDRLRTALTPMFQRVAALIEERREAGWVRECHGDLHCANIVRWGGRLTPFDGIEFDPALRFIDVVNDVAFLTMDLAVRGRRDLRRTVLDAWTTTLGDYPGLALLRYYEAYRALVRAKVAALRAGQHATDSRAAVAAGRELRSYFDYSRDRAQEPAPRLILTCGLSGSGKTWLSRALAPQLDALHVRSDVERKRLAGLGPLADSRSMPGGGLYTREFNERTYRRLRDCAKGCLRGGENLIVDAAFLRADERAAMLELARELGATPHILYCTAPASVLRQRISSRQRERRDASEAGLDVLERQAGWREEFTDIERPLVVEVDTTRPDAAERALSLLTA
ncbi:MAG TPA: AAA family ATPase [Steroidobacteraceae bacterium]|nr:AAA family ATPase [Steroidobacteraceae bacterium]